MLKYILIAVVALLGVLLLVSQMGKPPVVETSSSVEDLLALLKSVPDTPETRSHVIINNYVAADEVLELQHPKPEFPAQIVMDYAYMLRTKGGLYKGPYITGFDENSNITLSVLRQNAGYDLRDIRQSLIAGLPPYDYQAVNLSISGKSLQDKLKNSQTWPAPTQEQYRGLSILSWGEELVPDENNRLNPPVFSPNGQGSRLGFSGQQILYTLTDKGIHQMIDAHAGEVPSLADIPEFGLLAEGAFGLKLYSMIFFNRTQSVDTLVQLYARIHPDEAEVKQYRDALIAEPKLKPYTAVATGIGKDSIGFYMGLVLVHEDHAGAIENSKLLLQRLLGEGVTTWKKPWNQLFNADDREFTITGKVLQARIYFADPSRFSNNWYDWFYLPDSLLLHE